LRAIPEGVARANGDVWRRLAGLSRMASAVTGMRISGFPRTGTLLSSGALPELRDRFVTETTRRGRWPYQPAATDIAAPSALRAAIEWSRLSREEISNAARIAPATAKPAPTRKARSNPLVKATEAL
jgi:hypothetical protein